MSRIQIKAFFKYCRVKVLEQRVNMTEKRVTIRVRPDERYHPVCHRCGRITRKIHSYNERIVRDLNVLDAQTYISILYRTVKCDWCGYMVEELPLISPYDRVTKRLAFYIIDLCQSMTIKEVAEHFGLNWKTVKEIHKQYLQERFSQEEIGDPGIIVVDEISIRKGHSYLTAIVDWESGRVLWIGEGRRYETLKEFFDSLSEEQRASIEAVAIDMWDPYIKAIEEHCPQAMIVFDLFHVVAAFGRAIDKIRNQEYKKANQSGKEVIKGSKYLLLKNKENITKEERPRLKALLKLNEPLTIAYILKDDLKNLWRYRYSKWAEKAIDNWCHLAYESKIKPLLKFAKTLKRYAHGIINHCRYPIHTSGMEGIINKIKVIKRKAYGYHDLEYFSLVIKSAFADIN